MTPEDNQDRAGAFRLKIALLAGFGIAMGYFEAAVVVYLRELYYPAGFTFPLKAISEKLIIIELVREVAAVVMIATVAGLAGRKWWERFGYFIIIFGIWDIFYYIWLKLTLDWPSSLLEWDILFLIPLPWIGPVIAPVSVAILMIVGGILITRLYARDFIFKVVPLSWVSWIAATAAILYSFMYDTSATIHLKMPQPYLYGLLISGLILYIAGFVIAYRRNTATR